MPILNDDTSTGIIPHQSSFYAPNRFEHQPNINPDEQPDGRNFDRNAVNARVMAPKNIK